MEMEMEMEMEIVVVLPENKYYVHHQR